MDPWTKIYFINFPTSFDEFQALHKGVSKNRGGPPKSSILIGFSIIFTIHFGGQIPLFLGFFTPKNPRPNPIDSKESGQRWDLALHLFQVRIESGSWSTKTLEDSWRIIPVSNKWLVTPIYKLFRPFIRGITPFSGLTNHGYSPLANWDDPPSLGPLHIRRQKTKVI